MDSRLIGSIVKLELDEEFDGDSYVGNIVCFSDEWVAIALVKPDSTRGSQALISLDVVSAIILDDVYLRGLKSKAIPPLAEASLQPGVARLDAYITFALAQKCQTGIETYSQDLEGQVDVSGEWLIVKEKATETMVKRSDVKVLRLVT